MRLKSSIWVQAYIKRCQSQDCFAGVIRHGDDDAGSIYIRISCLNGTSLFYEPAPTGFGSEDLGRMWMPAFDPMPVQDGVVNQRLEEIEQRDPDIWLIEVEDRKGRSFLDEELHLP